MATTGVQKICVACGENVADKPRTKDKQGRYYRNPCWAAKVSSSPQPSRNPSGTKRQQTPTKEASASSSDLIEPTDAEDPLAALAAAVPEQSSEACGADNSDWFTCPVCQSSVTMASMDGSGVCADCARPRAVATVAPRSAGNRTLMPRTGTRTTASSHRKVLLIALAVIPVLFGAFALLRGTFKPKHENSQQNNPITVSQSQQNQVDPQAEVAKRRADADLAAADAAKAKIIHGEVHLVRGDGSLIVPVDMPVYLLPLHLKKPDYSAEVQAASDILDREMAESLWTLPVAGLARSRETFNQLCQALQKDEKEMNAADSFLTKSVLKDVALSVVQRHEALRTTGSLEGNDPTPALSEYSELTADTSLTGIIGKVILKKTTTDRTGNFSIEEPDTTDHGFTVVGIYQDNFNVSIWIEVVRQNGKPTELSWKGDNADLIVNNSGR